MINLYDGELMDLLRGSSFADNVEVQCISYALKSETKRLIEVADSTMTSAAIDKLPEKILDILAVELRSFYYDESFDLAKKRKVIKNTLRWYMKAGTPEAMREFIKVVFGYGDIVEWFEYTEAPYTPGTFDVIVNADLTEDAADHFIKTVESIKNIRSHIRHIIFNRVYEQVIYTGVERTRRIIKGGVLPNDALSENEALTLHYGQFRNGYTVAPIIPNAKLSEKQQISVKTGSAVYGHTVQPIPQMDVFPINGYEGIFTGVGAVNINIKNTILQGGT